MTTLDPEIEPAAASAPSSCVPPIQTGSDRIEVERTAIQVDASCAEINRFLFISQFQYDAGITGDGFGDSNITSDDGCSACRQVLLQSQRTGLGCEGRVGQSDITRDSRLSIRCDSTVSAVTSAATFSV